MTEFLIAQHTTDLFRREPKNVGVFVRHEGRVKARFYAEQEPGEFDGRKTRKLPFPDVYVQWVEYWRRTIAQRPDTAWDEIRESSRGNYQIIDGGMVDRVGEDPIDSVVDYLYTSLVSEGGIAAALGAPDATEAARRLGESIGTELKKRNLLDAGAERALFAGVIKHPVRRDMPVSGKTADHLLSFYQQNGHPTAMEPVDLTVKRDKRRMTERAGWVSLVFEDIWQRNKKTESIAIISATEDDLTDDAVAYSLKLLKAHAKIVNWQSELERTAFLEARAENAKAD